MTYAGQKAKDIKIANQSIFSYNKGQKINDAEPIPSIVIIPTSKEQKVENAKSYTEDTIKKTCTGHIIKLSIKTKDAKKILLNS